MTPLFPHRRFTPQTRESSIRWPDASGLAVSFVLNVEEGAETTLSAGDTRNEGVHEVNHEIAGSPDFCMETHFEYGARAGYPRIAQRFADAGLPITLNVCGRALECTPWVAQDAAAYGWELCGHGWLWESPVHMSREQERASIERTVAAITQHSGRPPTGWHCKSSASVHMRGLLQEMGFLYDSNDYGGEVPYMAETASKRPYVVLPYAFDTNDMRFFGKSEFVQADDFARYTIAAIDALLQEAESAPRLLTIGLHSRILGRPARIGALDAILSHLRKKAQEGQPAWIATREAIARHWLKQAPNASAPDSPRPHRPA
ncbi:MAG: polysaccharide deacetylase family protein [Ottowia sp.]|uniref:polysaccharide deacetylase family protein n=1 Tax=Ottowia sp. TaxID=1898956 RepID=UPI003C791FD5